MDIIRLLHLKGLYSTLSEIRFFVKTLRKYRKILKTGKYVLFPTMRAMSIKESNIYEKANKYFFREIPVSPTVKLVNAFNKCGVFYNNSQSEQLYDAFYIANNYNAVREIKLFAFDKKKILTICANHNDFEEQLLLYNNLHSFYNLPLITQTGRFENSYEISMVDCHSRPDEIHALTNILASAMNNSNRNAKKHPISELLSYNYSDTEMNSILNDIYGKIPSDLLNSNFSVCMQHGDLSRDNLIYGESDGKTNFWWIDWEHIAPRIFLYDYFFYMINTAFCYHDTSALDAYMNGNHNGDLKKYFEFFEMKFDPAKLEGYFLVFLIVFFKERICDLGHLGVLKDYCNYLKEIKLLT